MLQILLLVAGNVRDASYDILPALKSITLPGVKKIDFNRIDNWRNADGI